MPSCATAAPMWWPPSAVNKTELLNRAAQTAGERTLLARALDRLEQAQRGVPACTAFLSGAEQEAVERLLSAAGRPRHLFSGGFPDAERKVCAFLPDWQEEDGWEPPFTALRCRWRAGESLTHRDLLGAVLGQGLEREKVGDILVRPDSCDLLVMRELAPYLLQNLDSAGRVRLKTEEISLEGIEPPQVTGKTVRDTVSTPRLDAVLSSGFSIARGKAADLISAGKVELNHRPCVKPDRAVAQGDVITCRGLGKCVLRELGGLSKKGRTMLVLERYL
ncbi:RNA-binding protein [Candidatus Pseudoscillospira sp. SGI.172]